MERSKIKLHSLKKCLLLLKMFELIQDDSPAFNLTVTSHDDVLTVWIGEKMLRFLQHGAPWSHKPWLTISFTVTASKRCSEACVSLVFSVLWISNAVKSNTISIFKCQWSKLVGKIHPEPMLLKMYCLALLLPVKLVRRSRHTNAYIHYNLIVQLK